MVKKKTLVSANTNIINSFFNTFDSEIVSIIRKLNFPDDFAKFEREVIIDKDAFEVYCRLSVIIDDSCGASSTYSCIYPLKDSDNTEDAKHIALVLAWEMMRDWGWDGLLDEFIDAELI